MTVPPPTPTIRSLAEAILADHGQHDGWNECDCGDFFDTCRSRKHARAILDALDAADRERTSPSNWISVYDPSPAPRPNTPEPA